MSSSLLSHCCLKILQNCCLYKILNFHTSSTLLKRWLLGFPIPGFLIPGSGRINERATHAYKINSSIEVSKRKSTNETNMELSKQPKQPNICAVRTLDYYINDTSLPAILARMTACDGLSFNVFTTSLDIRRSISALGHSIPESVSGVRDQVVKYGQQLREEVKRSIHISKSKGAYFSLTLDKWTSVQNKRYLNINIHGNNSFWNLCLIRVWGRFSSEACSNVIVHKLNEFGVNTEKDIVAITTDGCSMMKKLGRSISSLQQVVLYSWTTTCDTGHILSEA